MKNNKYDFVLDCSVAMAWCFEDERDPFTDGLLEEMEHAKVVVPSIWPLEVANVLLLAERKKMISSLQVSNFIDALSAFSIRVDHSTSTRAMHTILRLAEKTKLTIYDASYLEIAFREKIPLATLDKNLIVAAKSINVPLRD